jgi:hypothetical protein
MRTLEEENRQVLCLVQALLGAVSANFRAVSICFHDSIVIYFLLCEENVVDREEIEDIEFEFLAQQSQSINVSTEIEISNKPIDEIRLPGRLVFLRREVSDVPVQ